MLPSSASTTSNLAVTGVSGTVENRPARQVKLRNTSGPVGARNLSTAPGKKLTLWRRVSARESKTTSPRSER
jgi:hypothetical protein